MPSSTRRLIPDMTKPNWTSKYSWAQNVVIMIILASFYSTVLWILVRRVWFYIKMFICCLLHNIGSIAMRKKSPITWTATKFQQYSAIMLSVKQPWLNIHVKWFSCYWRPFFFIWLWLENWPETLCTTQTVLSSTADAVSNQVLSPCSWNSLSTVNIWSSQTTYFIWLCSYQFLLSVAFQMGQFPWFHTPWKRNSIYLLRDLFFNKCSF